MVRSDRTAVIIILFMYVDSENGAPTPDAMPTSPENLHLQVAMPSLVLLKTTGPLFREQGPRRKVPIRYGSVERPTQNGLATGCV